MSYKADQIVKQMVEVAASASLVAGKVKASAEWVEIAAKQVSQSLNDLKQLPINSTGWSISEASKLAELDRKFDTLWSELREELIKTRDGK